MKQIILLSNNFITTWFHKAYPCLIQDATLLLELIAFLQANAHDSLGALWCVSRHPRIGFLLCSEEYTCLDYFWWKLHQASHNRSSLEGSSPQDAPSEVWSLMEDKTQLCCAHHSVWLNQMFKIWNVLIVLTVLFIFSIVFFKNCHFHST